MKTNGHSLRVITAALVLAFSGLWLTGCGPSDEERAKGAERAALAGQQNTILGAASSGGANGCLEAFGAARAWQEAHQTEIAASDSWWNALGEGTKDTLYGEHDEFHDSSTVRITLLVRCGSDGELWDPGA